MHTPAPPSRSSSRRRAVLAGVVAAAALAAVPGSASAAIQVANAKSMSGVEGLQIDHQRVVSFDDAGACSAGAYTVTVSWGDGQSSAGTVVKALNASPSACSYDAEGSHVYAAAGAYSVNATICRAAECVTTPVPGTATVRAAEKPVETTAQPAAAPAAIQPAATQVQPLQQVQPKPLSPTLDVLGPVRRSQVARQGLRLRLGLAGMDYRRLSARLVDPATGRTLGRTDVSVKAAIAASAATLRLHFPRKAIRRLHSRHTYGVVLSARGGLPTVTAQFRLR